MSSANGNLASLLESRIRKRTVRPQFLLAALAGVAAALDIGVVYAMASGTAAEQLYGGVIIILMAIYGFAPLLVWVASAFLVFVAARSLGARAEFGVLFRAMGWGLLPLALSLGSVAAGRYLALRDTDICSVSGITCNPASYNRLGEQIGGIFQVLGGATGETSFLALTAVAAGLFLLTGYAWVYAVEGTSTLTRAGAAVAVTVPIAVFGASFALVTF
jgi:hypothetical protein